jgi:glyoxylase-like metal-dependent hydrolase (beta-lactamase superfamily II)
MDSMWGMKLPDVERWSERVVVARGRNPGPFTGPGTNTCLLGTGARRILLDTGSGRPEYIPILKDALAGAAGAREIGEVVLTHVHPDHIGGAADVLRHFGAMPVRKLPWPGRDEPFGLALEPLAHDDVIRADGATLRAIHTPGHAQDHLCFYLEEEQALFTGDLILGAGTTVIPTDGGDMALYLDSLERLLQLPIACIYPAHGPKIERAHDKIREYLAHRRERERQILLALRDGVGAISAIVERIYVGTPPALFPAAGQSVLSHLLKLERERRAARSVDAAGAERWQLA